MPGIMTEPSGSQDMPNHKAHEVRVSHRDISAECSVDRKVLVAAWPKNFGKELSLSEEPLIIPQELFHGPIPSSNNKWSNVNDPLWKSGWTGSHPPVELVDIWISQPLTSAYSCLRQVSTGTNTNNETFSDQAMPISDNHANKSDQIRFSKPIYSKDKHQAILLVWVTSKDLGGGIWISYLSDKTGFWKVDGRRTLVAS